MKIYSRGFREEKCENLLRKGKKFTFFEPLWKARGNPRSGGGGQAQVQLSIYFDTGWPDKTVGVFHIKLSFSIYRKPVLVF